MNEKVKKHKKSIAATLIVIVVSLFAEVKLSDIGDALSSNKAAVSSNRDDVTRLEVKVKSLAADKERLLSYIVKVENEIFLLKNKIENNRRLCLELSLVQKNTKKG